MLPEWLVVLIIILIIILDVLLVLGLGALVVLFAVFKVGKLAYDLLNRAIEWLVYRVLCLLEDLLESPPLMRFPFLSYALVGVKVAYDLLNGFQSVIERIIAVAVVLAAVAFGFASVCALVILNATALWLAWSYHLI